MSNNNPAPTIEEPEANETSTNARTQIRRIPKNARDEKTFLYDVIDASYICHVAFADDAGTIAFLPHLGAKVIIFTSMAPMRAVWSSNSKGVQVCHHYTS